jgi:hypothetical protein
VATLSKVLLPATYDLIVQPKGTAAIVRDDYFVVKIPEISRIDPPDGGVGAGVTIYGRFFGNKKGKVYLEGTSGGTAVQKSCKVTLWQMDPGSGDGEIHFVVPKGLSSGLWNLTISNKVGSVTEAGGFRVE